MNMLKALIPLLTFTVMWNASAGDKGHGGGGHACGEKVELYDFFEGRSPFLHNIPVWETDPSLEVRDYIQKALEHLKQDAQEIGLIVEEKVNGLLAIPYKDLVLPVLIPRTLDADLPIIEEGCEFKQVASWNERFGKVFFSRSVYERMDNKSKAGLFLHEAMYKIARDSGLDKNSDGIRKLVAEIFSDTKLSVQDLEKFVFPQGSMGVVPRDGSCELSVEVTSINLDNLSFNVVFGLPDKDADVATTYTYKKGTFSKREIQNKKIIVPCKKIWEKGLYASYTYSYLKPMWDINISFKVNGKKVTSDHTQEMKELADLMLRANDGYKLMEPMKEKR